jgi:hypothetical protein
MLYVVIIAALALLLLLFFGLWKLLRFLVATWQSVGPYRLIKRVGVVFVVFGLSALPFAGQFFMKAAQTTSRIPEPLHASKVVFEVEENLGFGPGGNETGFVVYELKNKSTQWLQDQGQALGGSLPGGNAVWFQTPIIDSEATEPWFVTDTAMDTTSEVPTIANYLNRYGFSISIDAQIENELNQSLRKKGCWYSYGRGGSVTVVNPTLGRVYFAYSG